jgi:hypothetical protein
VLLRREAALSVGGFDESFRVIYEDMAFYVKLFLAGPALVARGCWDRYRQHPDSSCHVAVREGAHHPDLPNPDRGRYLRWVNDLLNDRGERDAGVRAALDRALWPYRHPVLHRAGRLVKASARRVVSPGLRTWLRGRINGEPYTPPPGWVRMGALRRLTPISRTFGLDRGTPVDRVYIERFLGEHASDVRGRVLEIGDATYTRRFGADRVTRSDVLHAEPGNPDATLVGDLESGRNVPAGEFDCVILTQTFSFLFDVRAALAHARDALRPGGVMLATVAGISQISRYDMDRWGDFWRFTSKSVRRLFDEAFGAEYVTVTTYGNVLAATALLHGLAQEELNESELLHHDPDYELIIAIRAVKPRQGES